MTSSIPPAPDTMPASAPPSELDQIAAQVSALREDMWRATAHLRGAIEGLRAAVASETAPPWAQRLADHLLSTDHRVTQLEADVGRLRHHCALTHDSSSPDLTDGGLDG